MNELTVPDVIHRVPPLVEEARQFLRRCRRTTRPHVHVWRGPKGDLGAVYPGSFDPWTLAHEAILRAAKRRVTGPVLVLLDLDTIDKPAHVAPLADRLAILALHFADDPRVAIGVSTHGRFLEKARALGSATFIVGHDTHERALAPRYYEDPERDLAELQRRARFLVAPRGGRHRGDLALSPIDQARSATLARRAFAAGKLPWDQLAPDVLLACWQLRLYGVKRLMPVWVVTAFLERNGQALLVLRGQEVGTHRGSWSGVSGYLDWPVRWLRTLIECGPGRAALRQVKQEILEETGIEPKSLRLVHSGNEVAGVDPKHRREWRVRPFLFHLADGVEPRLDWENIECAWVPPSFLRQAQVVPRLEEALESACGGWTRWFQARLRDLVLDRRSGAMEIARRFLEHAQEAREVGLRGFGRAGARRLAAAHPMAPLAWLRDELDSGATPEDTLAELELDDESLLDEALERLETLASLTTYGYSSTVLRLLETLEQPVTILRDDDGHGERLLARLRAIGVEANLSDQAPSHGVLLLGADAVLPDGSIINAKGTSEAIRKARLPVVVLAQACKFVDKAPRLRPGFERVPAEGLEIIGA